MGSLGEPAETKEEGRRSVLRAAKVCEQVRGLRLLGSSAAKSREGGEGEGDR